MVLLTAAVVVLTALVLIDLVLTGAIIRRLRAIETMLTDGGPDGAGLAPGQPLPAFVSGDGAVSSTDLAGRSALIGLFSASCRHCPDQAERLAERAGELTERGVEVVSVLTVADGEPDTLGTTLGEAGRLVVEALGGAVSAAFPAEGTPTLLLFGEDGRLVTKAHAVDEVLGRA